MIASGWRGACWPVSPSEGLLLALVPRPRAANEPEWGLVLSLARLRETDDGTAVAILPRDITRMG